MGFFSNLFGGGDKQIKQAQSQQHLSELQRQRQIQHGTFRVNNRMGSLLGMGLTPEYQTWLQNFNQWNGQGGWGYSPHMIDYNLANPNTDADYRTRIGEFHKQFGQRPEMYRQTRPGLHDQAYDSQLKYGQEQIDQAHKTGKEELTYALARTGNIDSTAQDTGQATLASDKKLAESDSAATAEALRSEMMNAVMGEQAALYSMLQQGMDPAMAQNMAQSSGAMMRSQEPLMSMGPIFQNTAALINGMNQRPDLLTMGAGGATPSNAQTPWERSRSSSSGSGRVVR